MSCKAKNYAYYKTVAKVANNNFLNEKDTFSAQWVNLALLTHDKGFSST